MIICVIYPTPTLIIKSMIGHMSLVVLSLYILSPVRMFVVKYWSRDPRSTSGIIMYSVSAVGAGCTLHSCMADLVGRWCGGGGLWGMGGGGVTDRVRTH
jgi:hypothetical protein